MSIESVREYFRPLGREQDIVEFPVSSATVQLAAEAVGVIPARIAKSLSFFDYRWLYSDYHCRRCQSR